MLSSPARDAESHQDDRNRPRRDPFVRARRSAPGVGRPRRAPLAALRRVDDRRSGRCPDEPAPHRKAGRRQDHARLRRGAHAGPESISLSGHDGHAARGSHRHPRGGAERIDPLCGERDRERDGHRRRSHPRRGQPHERKVVGLARPRCSIAVAMSSRSWPASRSERTPNFASSRR